MSTTSTSPATDDHPDLRQLADRAEIIDLVHRLGVHLDESRFDDLRELIVQDATVMTPGGQSQGREALIAQAHRTHPADQRFQHVIANVLVDLDGDGHTARVRANLIVHITTPNVAPTRRRPAPALVAALGEVYQFEVVRTPGGWRFSRIQTTPLWLSGTLPAPADPDGG